LRTLAGIRLKVDSSAKYVAITPLGHSKTILWNALQSLHASSVNELLLLAIGRTTLEHLFCFKESVLELWPMVDGSFNSQDLHTDAMTSLQVLFCAVLDLVKLDAIRPMLLNVRASVAWLYCINEPITLALGFLLSLLSGSLLPLPFRLLNTLACHTKSVFLADVALSPDAMPVDVVIIDRFDAERCVVST
jgi:hypothetical protein